MVFQKVKGWAGNRKVQAIMAVAADSWGHTALRREQQDNNYMGTVLQNLEAGQHPRVEGHC
jgi:hypothetical protein